MGKTDESPPVLGTPAGADLQRVWMDAVRERARELPDLPEVLRRELETLAVGQVSEETLLAVVESLSGRVETAGLDDQARILSRRMGRAVYEYLLAAEVEAERRAVGLDAGDHSTAGQVSMPLVTDLAPAVAPPPLAVPLPPSAPAAAARAAAPIALPPPAVEAPAPDAGTERGGVAEPTAPSPAAGTDLAPWAIGSVSDDLPPEQEAGVPGRRVFRFGLGRGRAKGSQPQAVPDPTVGVVSPAVSTPEAGLPAGAMAPPPASGDPLPAQPVSAGSVESAVPDELSAASPLPVAPAAVPPAAADGPSPTSPPPVAPAVAEAVAPAAVDEPPPASPPPVVPAAAEAVALAAVDEPSPTSPPPVVPAVAEAVAPAVADWPSPASPPPVVPAAAANVPAAVEPPPAVPPGPSSGPWGITAPGVATGPGAPGGAAHSAGALGAPGPTLGAGSVSEPEEPVAGVPVDRTGPPVVADRWPDGAQAPSAGFPAPTPAGQPSLPQLPFQPVEAQADPSEAPSDLAGAFPPSLTPAPGARPPDRSEPLPYQPSAAAGFPIAEPPPRDSVDDTNVFTSSNGTGGYGAEAASETSEAGSGAGRWTVRLSPRAQQLHERRQRARLATLPKVVEEVVEAATQTRGQSLDRGRGRRAGRAVAGMALPAAGDTERVFDEMVQSRRFWEAAALAARIADTERSSTFAAQACALGERCRGAKEVEAAAVAFLSAVLASPPCERALWQLAALAVDRRDPGDAARWLEFVAKLLRARTADQDALAVYRQIMSLAPNRRDVREIVRRAALTGSLPD